MRYYYFILIIIKRKRAKKGITPEALELIDALLSLDPAKRPSAEKALDFTYFFSKCLKVEE